MPESDGLLTVLVVALALALTVVSVAAARQVRRLRATLARQDSLLRSLERDMQAVWVGAKGMGDAVVSLEQRLARMTERQDRLDQRDPDQRTYQHAIRLTQGGAGVEELMEVCGIARNEAELIHRLHHRDRHAH